MIKINEFGKSHWSLLLYVETRCVDFKGKLDLRYMRIDGKRHPGLDMNGKQRLIGPTFLKDSVLIENYDDWDCMEDLEREGLIEIGGTGIEPILKIKERGWKVVGDLRWFKADGGQCADFVF